MSLTRTLAARLPRPSVTRLEAIALAAIIVPLVVAVVKARMTGWLPLGDDAWFTTRSRDVLTSHNPLIGAWSSGSQVLEEAWLNNLGPLQLDLLAPFTKLSPYWGTAVGTAAINGGAVVGVWSVARRLLGPLGFAVAMLATVLLQLGLGSHGLIDPSQHLALVMPFWCLLWLCAALATGEHWALPWTALVASLVLQTHFTYAYQTVALVAVAGIAWIVVTRGQRQGRRRRWWVWGAAGVTAVCWAQPLWDQFFGTGNLANVLTHSGGGGGGPGLVRGVRFVADAVLEPPLWLPGTMHEFNPRFQHAPMWWMWSLLLIWVVALIATTTLAWRRRRKVPAAMGCISLVAIASGIAAASSIPESSRYSYVTKNYWWLWPIGAFITVTVAAGAAIALQRHAWRIRQHAPRFVTAAVAVTTCFALLSPIPGWLGTGRFEIGYEVGADLLGQLDASLEDLDLDGPLVIDLDRADDQSHFEYTLLAALQEHGIEFTYPPGAYSIARFGSDRCETGDASHRIVLSDGVQTQRRDGERLLASVDVMSPAQARELESLDQQFGRLLRIGAVDVDVTPDSEIRALHWLNRIDADRLRDVLRERGRPAAGVADTIYQLWRFGRVEMADYALDDFWRWHELEMRLRDRRIAIYLAPFDPPLGKNCESVAPGDIRIVYPG